MNTQNKNSQHKGLPRKDYRWRWMAGAAAGAAAGITGTQAANVTVGLGNNYLSATPGGYLLNPDLTGDGTADVALGNTYSTSYVLQIGTVTETLTTSLGATYTTTAASNEDIRKVGIVINGSPSLPNIPTRPKMEPFKLRL